MDVSLNLTEVLSLMIRERISVYLADFDSV
jgi:hypothetical protein